MLEVRRGENNSWHVGVNEVGVYIRVYMSDPINIPVQDARDIAHSLLELTEHEKVGVYLRTYMSDPINISVQDARDIAHAILELTDGG